MRRLTWVASLALLLLAVPAGAQSLDSVKAQGLVGERADGLLGFVGDPPAGVRQLVNAINDRRLAEYQEIARRTGTSLPAVQAIAGEKAIAASPPGTFVMGASGGWRRK